MKKKFRVIAICLCLSMLISACGAGSGSESDSINESTDHKGQEEEAAYQGKLDIIQPTAYNNVYGLNLEPGAYLSVIGKRENGAYWKEIQKGVRQAADDLNEELGYEGADKVKVTFNAPSTPDNIDDQVNILDEELSRYPQAVAISVADLKACEVQFDLATENDIPIVAYDSGSDYEGLMATVATDNEVAAREAAGRLAESMNDFGQVIVFAHDSKSQAALSRQAAFVEELKNNHPHIEVVGVYALDNLDETRQEVADEMNNGTFSLKESIIAEAQEKDDTESEHSEEAVTADDITDEEAVTEDDITDEEAVTADDITDEEVIDFILSKYPNVRGCFATNSTALETAMDSFERMDMDTSRINIMGFDINDTIIEALKNGTVDGIVLQNPFGIGYAAVIASARAALDMGNEAVVDTGYTWVTKDNLEDEAIQKMLY